MIETNTVLTRANDAGAGVHPSFALVLVAAGSGSRLGYGRPKAEVSVAGKEILRWALEGADAAARASRIVVTVPAGDNRLTAIADEFGALAVTGGVTRADSVAAALAAIPQAPQRSGAPGDSGQEPTAVLVHDGARCFTPAEVFESVLAALGRGERAVIPAVPVVDTIKTIDGSDYVSTTPDRSRLRAVQTPQGFDLATLRDAYRRATERGLAESITDDAMLAETMGIPVKIVAGSTDSFKITTPVDLTVAEALCAKE